MYAALARVVLRQGALDDCGVIPWASPVPFFGPLRSSRIATVGINPSNREFVDETGGELGGHGRRLPTLGSLGLRSWEDADASHIREILLACSSYFSRNPYDRWFRVLDKVLEGLGVSLYDHTSACHLDLIPYATFAKWTEVRLADRRQLLCAGREALGDFLRESAVELLVLNGRSVVRAFEELSGSKLDARIMENWTLPRVGKQVEGIAYRGNIDAIGGVLLDRPIRVVGFNHNLQSSYGVTRGALAGIREWISVSMDEPS